MADESAFTKYAGTATITGDDVRKMMESFNELRTGSRAYLVVPPDFMSQIPMVAMPETERGIGFRTYMDYCVKVMTMPSFLFRGESSGQINKPYVPRPAVVVESSPAWHIGVVVAFGIGLLCMAAGVFG